MIFTITQTSKYDVSSQMKRAFATTETLVEEMQAATPLDAIKFFVKTYTEDGDKYSIEMSLDSSVIYNCFKNDSWEFASKEERDKYFAGEIKLHKVTIKLTALDGTDLLPAYREFWHTN